MRQRKKTIPSGREGIRPYTDGDYQHRKRQLFSREEIAYLDFVKPNRKRHLFSHKEHPKLSFDKRSAQSLSTFKKYLLWPPSENKNAKAKKEVKLEGSQKELAKTFLLIIFLMSVYNIEVIGDEVIGYEVKYNQQKEIYYGFYDRSFAETNDFGICEVTIIDNFWARIVYHYPVGTYKGTNELWVFGRVEYSGSKGILIIKNFEDFEGDKKTEAYKLGPVENFMLLYNDGGRNKQDEPNAKNDVMMGNMTSYYRKGGFIYSSTVILIEQGYFKNEFKLLSNVNKEINNGNDFWKKIIENRNNISGDKDENPLIIAPIYYFLFHQSLTFKHYLQDIKREFQNANPFNKIEAIPFFDESKLINLIEGKYIGVSFFHHPGLGGKNNLIITRLIIEKSGKVELEVENDKVDNSNKIDYKLGFIKHIEKIADIKKPHTFYLVIALRYNFIEHYQDMLINLEFENKSGKGLNTGDVLYGTFSTRDVYTDRPVASRIIFEKVEEKDFIDNEPEFTSISNPKYAKILQRDRIKEFYLSKSFDSYSDFPAIEEQRKLWNESEEEIFEGKYFIFIGAKPSFIDEKFPDKLPSLFLYFLTINKDSTVTFDYDKREPLNGTIERKGSKIFILLRGEELFHISFNASRKFSYCFGTLTCFSESSYQSESYMVLLWKNSNKLPNNLKVGEVNIFINASGETILKYEDLIKQDKIIIDPRIGHWDDVLQGHLRFLLGTEMFRMIRTVGNVDPSTRVKYQEHRQLYFESAIFQLKEKKYDKASIALIKAFLQGFASPYYKGKKIDLGEIPEELKKDYDLFEKYYKEIKKSNEKIKKIVLDLWGNDILKIWEIDSDSES